MKPPLKTYEIMHLLGRRIVSSFQVQARDGADADRKSESERKKRGITRYRIAEVKSDTRPKHGGVHQRAFDWRNHPA